MTGNKRLFVCILALILCAATLCACGESAEEKQNKEILDLAIVASAEDIAALEKYPNLQSLDLRGSDCYEEILGYIASHPEVRVRYDVAVGSNRYDVSASSLEIPGGSIGAEDLVKQLKYLPNVTEILLPDTQMTPEEITLLESCRQDLQVSYTVSLAGNSYGPETEEIDLSALTSEDIDSALEKLTYLPNVTRIELMKSDGTAELTKSDVKKIQEALPNASVSYSFDLFGKTVSTLDEVIEYDEVDIGNDGETEIREALDILTACRYIKFDDCGIDSTVMASIRDDYPDVKVVWRIHIGKYSLLTDETMMRLTFVLEDDRVSELKYCTDIVFMDVGHNDFLSDFNFVSYMPNLECAIVSGSCISDLSVFSNCKNLVWLEMCYCGFINDLSPLKELANLKYLNVSFTSVRDLTPLDNLPLERFMCQGPALTGDQRQDFVDKHPDCLFVTKGSQPFGYGWRYNDYGYTFFEYYKHMREVFRYDEESYTGNVKE